MLFTRNKKEKNNKNGFALLFSVLVSSLLLTIGLSIFSIALKELSISTASRQSIYAFYAANSGFEYAKYHDLKLGDFPDISSEVSNSSISRSANISLPVVNGEGPNFIVTVTKTKPNNGTCDIGVVICTSVTSVGHDTDGSDRVERAINQTY